MHADFDALVETVRTVSPQDVVRRKVTGIDPLVEVAALRSGIDNINSTEAFASLLGNALTAFQDGHTSFFRAEGMLHVELKRWGFLISQWHFPRNIEG